MPEQDGRMSARRRARMHAHTVVQIRPVQFCLAMLMHVVKEPNGLLIVLVPDTALSADTA